MSGLASLPKAELHIHLEAGASPALVRRNAARYRVDVSRLFDDEGQYLWTDFAGFLGTYALAASVFRTPEDFAELTEGYLAASAAEGCVYTEFFVSPDFAEDSGLGYKAYLDGIVEGVRRAEAVHGIAARLIPIIVRHLGPERAVAVAEAAVRHSVPEVVGFGMAGEERVHEPRDFVRAFAIADEAGLKLTCHAGEWSGADAVRASLDALGPKRIGHGVRAVEDPSLVRRIADEGIHLEVCPVSNVVLGVFPDYVSHPFARLREMGVRVSLNSDDPPFFHDSIGHTYAVAAREFGFDATALAAVTRTAIEDAFCDEATKARLLARL